MMDFTISAPSAWTPPAPENLNLRNGKKGEHSVALIRMREHTIYFDNAECDGALFIVSLFSLCFIIMIRNTNYHWHW